MGPDLQRRVEETLRKVRDFGEVRLVVVKGWVRFIEITQNESIDGRPQTGETPDERPGWR